MHANMEVNGLALAEFNIPTDSRFMQPLIHGFPDEFSIPVSFLEQIELQLQGRLLESVVLMIEQQPRRHWLVYVEGGRHFKDGWKEFCDYHHLKVGEFLVFTHKTKFAFSVCVYDPVTACQRHFARSGSPIPRSKGQSMICGSNTLNTKTKETEDEAALIVAPEQPQVPICHVVITSKTIYNRKKHSSICLPRPFMIWSGLWKRECWINLVDARENHWQVKLSCRRLDGTAIISGGWKKFLTSNCIKHTSVVSFELIQAGRSPVLKCSVRRWRSFQQP